MNVEKSLLEQMAEAIGVAQGSTSGLHAVVQALIETHPQPAALLQRLQEIQKRAAKALDEVPPPPIQRFRCEQVIEEMADSIQRRLRDSHG